VTFGHVWAVRLHALCVVPNWSPEARRHVRVAAPLGAWHSWFPVAVWLSPNRSASRKDMFSTFFARGVNGRRPDCGACCSWLIICSVCWRTASRLIPGDSSALAATPSPLG
jgi:hypothetical protein